MSSEHYEVFNFKAAAVSDAPDQNDWSRYQNLVLQQLNALNDLSAGLNEQHQNLKEKFAVHEAEGELWGEQKEDQLLQLNNKIESLIAEKNSLKESINKIEKTLFAEESTRAKEKAINALYGSIAVFIITSIIQILAIYYKVN